MVDRVDDRGGLVDVAEAVARADGPDHEELRVTAEAGDSLAVVDGARGEGGDERPMAVVVPDASPVVNDVPGLG